MSSKLALVSLVVGCLATGAAQKAAARLPASAPNPLPAAAAQPLDTTLEVGNPYNVIVSQNIFHLVPAPPPPPPPPAPDPVVPATIKLTGLVKIEGQKTRAMFVSLPKDPKDIAYYNLSEGERQGALVVVRISEDKELAEVLHDGAPLTVLLKDSKPAIAAAAAPAPFVPAPPLPITPMNSIIGASRSQPGGAGVMMAGGAMPTPTLPGGQQGQANGMVPMRALRGDTADQANQATLPRSLEEAHLLFAADTMLHQSEIDSGKYPPPPPMVQSTANGDDPTAQQPPGMEMPSFTPKPTKRPRRF